MKNIKALFILVLALIMTMSLATTAFAAKITIDDGDVTGAEYSAYKLLNATEGENDNFAYTVNSKYRAALKTDTGKTTDEQIVAYIATLTAAEDIRAFADEIYELIKGETAEYVTTTNAFEDIDQGYYLIEESKVGSAEGYDKDTVSLVMLDTAGLDEIEIKAKEELPTSEKKVKDKNDTTGDVTDWQDSADYDIGDAVPFKITFVLPGDFGVYDSYFVGIHDIQAEGLTYNNDLKVSVGEANLTGAFTYTAAPENCENGCTFHIECADIIAYAKANGITLEAGDAIV
ncbi:MAG: isopeptide-forming domain-containing fimbrial protein, partial [Clostridia bacterium]|nr:isopeptide-forming domain-containing fimbrial protein [Clostridia bacterium]